MRCIRRSASSRSMRRSVPPSRMIDAALKAHPGAATRIDLPGAPDRLGGRIRHARSRRAAPRGRRSGNGPRARLDDLYPHAGRVRRRDARIADARHGRRSDRRACRLLGARPDRHRTVSVVAARAWWARRYPLSQARREGTPVLARPARGDRRLVRRVHRLPAAHRPPLGRDPGRPAQPRYRGARHRLPGIEPHAQCPGERADEDRARRSTVDDGTRADADIDGSLRACRSCRPRDDHGGPRRCGGGRDRPDRNLA